MLPRVPLNAFNIAKVLNAFIFALILPERMQFYCLTSYWRKVLLAMCLQSERACTKKKDGRNNKSKQFTKMYLCNMNVN